MKFASTLSALAIIATAAADVAIDFGTAANFTVIAVGGITNTGVSSVIGNVATTGHTVDGFGPGEITGDVETQTPEADQAHDDAEAVWNQLRALQGTQVVDSGDGTIVVTKGQGDADGNGTTNFTGAVLTPGIYNVFSISHVVTTLTLSGAGQFIITSGSHFNMDDGASIILADGATPENVFFATGDATNIGAGAHVQGTVLSNSAIRLAADSTVLGNIFTQGLMTFNETQVTPVH